MSESSKVHVFPHTVRTIAAANASMCQDKIYFYPVPPDRSLTIENLFVHLKFTFDAGVSAPNRTLEYIGIGNELPLFIQNDPSRFRKVDLNVAADGNRKIDVKLDLSHLLEKSHVGYRELFDDGIATDLTYVIIKFNGANRGVGNTGTINLCKIDTQYTTEGIR